MTEVTDANKVEKTCEPEALFAKGHRACAGCAATIAINTVLDAVGKDVIVVNATGCMEIVSSPYPESAWKVPYIHVTFENMAAVASGISRALKAKGNTHTKVVIIAGDGATYDIGFGVTSGMFERNEDVLYICYDNEAYMNTGVQRSSSTPKFASTTTSRVGDVMRGKQEWKKPILEIAAAHRIPYVASSSIAYPMDVEKKVKKALSHKGSKFLVIHAPCVPGWVFPCHKTIEMARLAVETGIWKMLECENGKWKITMRPRFKPLEQYTSQQKRFQHATPDEIAHLELQIKQEFEQLEKTIAAHSPPVQKTE